MNKVIIFFLKAFILLNRQVDTYARIVKICIPINLILSASQGVALLGKTICCSAGMSILCSSKAKKPWSFTEFATCTPVEKCLIPSNASPGIPGLFVMEGNLLLTKRYLDYSKGILHIVRNHMNTSIRG